MTSGWFGRQGKQGSRVGELLTKAHFPGSFHSYLEQEVGGTLTSPSSSVHACSLLVLTGAVSRGDSRRSACFSPRGLGQTLQAEEDRHPLAANPGPFLPRARGQILLRNGMALAARSHSSFLELLPCPCFGHTQGLPSG